MKLAIFDLDGTLFDTKDINFHAYFEALSKFGYDLEYDYYCNYCNGRHFMDFLPKVVGEDIEKVIKVHEEKKKAYPKYIDKAKVNNNLFDILRSLKQTCKIAMVTTASKKNCMEILDTFEVANLFDLILTHEDVEKAKPDPSGFIKAMQTFNVLPEQTVIFEDSEVGLKAAEQSGAFYFKTFGFN